MGHGDVEIIVLKVQGKQLGNVVFVFDNQDFVLPAIADVNSNISSCWRNVQPGRLCLSA
jgi:hypothetical protein